MVELAEIAGQSGLFKDGDWIESKDQNPNGDVRLIQLADIGIGEFLNKSNRFLTDIKANELKCTYLIPGDILIARMPDPIGRACIFPKINIPAVTAVDVCIVRPDNKLANNSWLKYIINSPFFRYQINQFLSGTTRQRISRTNLGKLKIPLPQLDEQKRIAAILDKADALRQKRKESIKLINEFLRSVFLDMFGDPESNPKNFIKVMLKSLVPADDKINYGVVQPGNNIDSGIPIIRIIDFEKMSINKNNFKKVHPDIDNKHKKSKLIGDEILIACVGSIGKIALIDESMKGFNIVRATARVRCNSSLNRIYLAHYLTTDSIQNYFIKTTRTVSQPTLNIKQIEETPIMLPPIKLQSKFEEVASKTNNVLFNMSTSLIILENQFKALVQKAFKGLL